VPIQWAQHLEKQADCFAAQRVSETAYREALQLFAMQGSNRPDWYHPTGYERIAVIRECRNNSNGTTPPRPTTQRCRQVTTYEVVTNYVTQWVTVQNWETRCGWYPTPYGPRQQCGQVLVPRQVPRQVPVQQRVPRQTTVCD
jgi:hypothetical protein